MGCCTAFAMGQRDSISVSKRRGNYVTNYMTVYSTTEPDSTISNLLKICVPLDPTERALALEASEKVEYAHAHAGKSGHTAAPDPKDDVEHHYVAFVTSNTGNGDVYEMDGMKQGPLKTDVTLKEGEDLLTEAGRNSIKAFIEREQGRSIGFSLMALVKT